MSLGQPRTNDVKAFQLAFLFIGSNPDRMDVRKICKPIIPSRIPDWIESKRLVVSESTPLINFYIRIGTRPQWKTIPAGAGWPDDKLIEIIDGYLACGTPVYVDFDQSLWDPGARSSREAAGLEMISQEYHLILARSPLLYRISRSEEPHNFQP